MRFAIDMYYRIDGHVISRGSNDDNPILSPYDWPILECLVLSRSVRDSLTLPLMFLDDHNDTD